MSTLNSHQLPTGLSSLEAIQFQNPVLFKALTAAIEPHMGQSIEQIYASDLTQVLEANILKFTGLPIRCVVGKNKREDKKYDYSIIVPHLTQTNALVTQTNVNPRKVLDVREFHIDYRTSRIDGNFTHLTYTLMLAARDMTSRFLSAEEIAAIILHEVGHVFTYFDFVGRAVRTNSALQEVAINLAGVNSDKDRAAVIVNARRNYSLAQIQEQHLIHASPEVLAIAFANAAAEELRSDLGMREYDNSLWEFSADQFSVRHGAGLALATGLDKLDRQGRTSFTMLLLKSVYHNFLDSLIDGIRHNRGGNILVSIAAAVVTNLIISAVFLFRPSENLLKYNQLQERFKRMRNQISLQLRERELDEQIAKPILAQLKGIDERIAASKYDGSYNNLISRFLSLTARRRVKQDELNQLFEDLAFTPLFEKSHELRLA